MKRSRVIVFLGPSLPLAEARKLVRADFRPPARQGDVFRALDAQPQIIALIDGVFESQPSVWHHELRAAHASGVALLGASSMGALRAAELPAAVQPVGEIASRFVSGEWNDDAAVALLHGDAESGYRPLTVPWVNVWATAQAAVETKILSQANARKLCHVAASQFYQSRTWSSVFEELDWDDKKASRVMGVFVDLKEKDARACLRLAARLKPAHTPARAASFSSFVRRTRLSAQVKGGPLDAQDGLKTLLLADFARQGGLVPDPRMVKKWRRQLKGPFAVDQMQSWAEAKALEEMVLMAPEYFVPDGPAHLEGAALVQALKSKSDRTSMARLRKI